MRNWTEDEYNTIFRARPPTEPTGSWRRGGQRMRNWTEDEYNTIFRARPPTEPTAPTTAEFERLGHELGRTLDAVRSQSHDARSLVLGNATAASRPLRDYMSRRGWL